MNRSSWTLPLETLQGLGVKRLQALHKLGLETLGDLVTHFPRRYEDWASLYAVADLPRQGEASCLAQCIALMPVRYQGRKNWFQAQFQDASGYLRVTWFNQPWMHGRLEVGGVYLLYGALAPQRLPQMNNPAIQRIRYPIFEAPDWQPDQLRPDHLADLFVRPVYPSASGLSQGLWRDLQRQALDQLAPELQTDLLPDWVRARYQLCSRSWAYQSIHFPQTLEDYRLARKRLAFEELFFIQLGLGALRSGHQQRTHAPKIPWDAQAKAQFKAAQESLPFALTAAQKRVLEEILADLSSDRPMDRLLQGDVGSGKTVVAALTLEAVIRAGYQGILLAPTSILVQQHAKTLQKFLAPRGVRIGVLVGQMRPAQRQQLLRAVADGEIDLLIGTHAVLNEAVEIPRLGLVVTDEQHRFGVNQRLAALKTPGDRMPHVLVMSATPIPRSLALILYGDLSLSVIDEKPAGRQPIMTYTVRPRDLPRAYAVIERNHLAQGQQVYVVCARKETEGESVVSAAQVAETLQNEVYPHYRVGLLHGQQKEREKQAIMAAFQAGEIQILVSTTVIEVGVDQPNATALLIRNAERFGLAQLHQLRGRVGRGSKASLCLLESDTDQELARKRLKTICQTEDGYEVAEADLRLRGPGDFFGTRQHGLPEFRIANLYEDQVLLKQAGEAVQSLLQQPFEHWPETLKQGLDLYLGGCCQGIGL